MGFDQYVWDFENERLRRATEVLEVQLNESRLSADSLKGRVISIQRSMWDQVNPTPSDLDDLANVWQFQTELEREGQKSLFASSRISRLEKMLKNPYFGRMDFREEDTNDSEKMYIGIANLTDGTNGEYLVYDWRAPASGMFYDYETGKAGYNCPAGRIEGEILLKRQYRIWQGRIELMFDCSLAIEDEILQEILGRSADSKMKTIVVSIQREQNRIIRDDTHRLILVQGPAGSGKTSIALHRAAYLLFRYREHVTADNIVIFSPNQVFSDYISSVLPELGEENMLRTTFFEYAQKTLDSDFILEDAGSQMDYLLSPDNHKALTERTRAIKFKSSRVFPGIIERYVKMVEESRVFEDVAYNGEIIENREEIEDYFFHGLGFLPVVKRLEKIRNRLNSKVDILVGERIKEVMVELGKTGEYPDIAEIRGRSTFIVREEFKPVRDIIDKMTRLDLHECYIGLFRKAPDILADLAPAIPVCFFEEDEAENMAVFVEKSFDEYRVCFEDIGPLLLLKGLLFGFQPVDRIKHVIIDEVQDYTPLQFLLMKYLFGHCGMTMLGDIDQAINPYMNAGSYENIAEVLDYEGTTLLHLNKSYRSTRQISDFCRGLLGRQGNIEYVNREGAVPAVHCTNNSEKIAEGILELREKGYKSIAVITRTADDSRILCGKLVQSIDIRLVSNKDTEFTAGTSILPSYLAKGLEFDAVLVYMDKADDYCREEERKLFYTVCTRALHELHFYSSDGIPKVLRHLDKNLYTVM